MQCHCCQPLTLLNEKATTGRISRMAPGGYLRGKKQFSGMKEKRLEGVARRSPLSVPKDRVGFYIYVHVVCRVEIVI